MSTPTNPLFLVTCLGNRDPYSAPTLDQPNSHSQDRTTDLSGRRPGPVLSALAAAKSQNITIGAVAILFAPGSDPDNVSSRAQSLLSIIQDSYSDVPSFLVPLQRQVKDLNPITDQEELVQLPVSVYEYAANLNAIPNAVNSVLKKHPEFHPSFLASGGTPQQNFALIDLARSLPDAMLFQLLDPTPHQVDAQYNRNNLRQIDIQALNSSSPLGQKIGDLQKEIQNLTAKVNFLENNSSSADGRELDIQIFSASGLTWRQISQAQQTQLLLQAAERNLTASEAAELLGITTKSVRQRVKEHDISLKPGASGRPKSEL